MTATNMELIRSLYAAFARGDVPAILASLDDQVIWNVHGPMGAAPHFGARRGKDGALAFFQAIGGGVQIDEFSVNEVIGAGDSVFALGVDRGRSPKTGRTYTTEFIHRWKIRDGKVVEFHEFFDSAAIAAAFSG